MRKPLLLPMVRTIAQLCAVALLLISSGGELRADTPASQPIVFVTMVPNPAGFGTLAATFGNHVTNPATAYRGGDLWIRYGSGTLKNLTAAAGFGNAGFQGSSSIAVRDPAVHWDGTRVLFSMVRGAPTQQYQLGTYRWQLYEISGLGENETPVITKVPHQPTEFNNVAPTYGSDDSIIFVSDRPRDSTVLHTYPQRDEYESASINSGIWKLNTETGALVILDHSPSGNFNPIVDSFGRVLFTRWDHLQRDQQNIGVDFGAFNYTSEQGTEKLSGAAEIFPEARSALDPATQPHVNLFTINQFFPWMMHQDGRELETLNHIGRQELGVYSNRSFNDDPNLEEFYRQYTTGANQNDLEIFLHLKEDPLNPGTYLGTSCPEFGTHSAGQIVSLVGPPGMNPDQMLVHYLTHPSTAAPAGNPGPEHSGLYRDPVPLTNGVLIASHTVETREDANQGSSTHPLSRYQFRLKILEKTGPYAVATTPLTGGISKSVSFWDPDRLVSYSGELWELMAVELAPRVRPSMPSHTVPSIEQGVMDSLGVSRAALEEYLRVNNLALVVSRDVTRRDRNDIQQPFNLRVPGGVASAPADGKVYDVSHLEFFQGDLIRGYGTSPGRRVLAQRMHSVTEGINPSLPDAALGAVRIAEDGSMAAFVPARRALTWQLAAPNGEAVVRERYWLTFQPGEIRVCGSCHGVNTADHAGNPPPQNEPIAFRRLLEHWQGSPVSMPPSYSLTFSGDTRKIPRGRVRLVATGSAAEVLTIRARIGSYRCPQFRSLPSGEATRVLTGKFPRLKRHRIQFQLFAEGSSIARASLTTALRGATSKSVKVKQACAALFRSMRGA